MNTKIIKITAFTDGSSTVYKDGANNRYGGTGVYFEGDIVAGVSNHFVGPSVTNQRMELTACINAIEACVNFSKGREGEEVGWELSIFTDSLYTVNCITKWSVGWIKNGWKRSVKGSLKDVSNLDLIKKLHGLTKKYKVKYCHVRAHQKEPPNKESEQWRLWYGNRRADLLAVSGKDGVVSA